MAAPILGPFVKSSQTNGPTGFCTSYSYQVGYRQTRDHSLVLPYRAIKGSAGGNRVTTGADSISLNAAPGYGTTASSVQAKAYAKFKDKLYDSAGLGIDLSQWKQSADMIEARAKQILSLIKILRKKDFGALPAWLKGAIGSHDVRGFKPTKSFANNFLETHFGWVPLLGDIYGAIQVFDAPLKDVHATSMAKSYLEFVTRTSTAQSSNTYLRQGFVFCRYGGYIKVTNPFLHLMEQLGLVNPAAVLWDAIPFSFVADWVGNVGQFLSYGTDFLGCSISQGYTTTGQVVYGEEQGFNKGPPSSSWSASGRSTDVTRSTGITLPSLTFHPIKPPSLSRATTAISLIVQKLKI